ncbi:hypothetical protein SAMN06265220_1098 [Flavobacterium nitrogenifigens]|uniref:Uncharacterized protein n=1 Tax=Flavobacterium nitrogenifigens TaxID=1617283 RepID=A0A521FDL6_9FLAO|nr:hypothetical protein SAMN06265220_1098 [Flavobacterium nitrogenifigens]
MFLFVLFFEFFLNKLLSNRLFYELFFYICDDMLFVKLIHI